MSMSNLPTQPNWDQYLSSEKEVKYPKRSDYETIIWYDQGEVIYRQEPGDPEPPEGLITENAVYQKLFNKDAFSEHRRIFGESERMLELRFKQDLFEYLGIHDNPKRHDLYAIAYEYGHSSGYAEVANYAIDLVSLIKD